MNNAKEGLMRIERTHRHALGALVLALALSACGDDADDPQASRTTTEIAGDTGIRVPTAIQRNVLLIIADDVGIDMIASYGPSGPWRNAEFAYDPAVKTPTITRLAEAGVLFSQAWSSPVCSPTRAGLYTGTYASRNGVGGVVTGSTNGLAPKWTTIAEAVAPDVTSAIFGKWHLGTGRPLQPTSQGFLHHAGLLEGGVSDYYCWAKTVDGTPAGTVQLFAGTEIRQDTATWISQQSGQWFAVMATVQPHATEGDHRFQLPPATCYRTDPNEFTAGDATVSIDLTPDACGDGEAESIPLYKANVECLDTQIDRLLVDIPDDVLERTTIIFVGDNGTPGSVVEGYDDNHAKGTLFEGGIHVPLIIADGYALVHGDGGLSGEILEPNDPGRIASPGRTVDALVQTVDLYETIVEILGASSPKQDSVSMKPYLADPNAAPQRSYIFTESFSAISYAGAIRDAEYKLIYDASDGCYALFDLVGSLPSTAESHNLVNEAEVQTVFERLRDQANAFLANTGSGRTFPTGSVPGCARDFDAK